MRKGFSVSATKEALQFLIPRTLCDELVVKGDDCPSWRVSLVVKFNIWLNKTRRVLNILKLLISIRNRKQRKNMNKNTIERRLTGQTLILFFMPGEHPPFDLLFFHHANLLHKSRPYKKSASYKYWRWTRTHGVTTYLRFSTTTGRERTVPGRAPAHTPLLELRTRTYFSLPPGTSYLPTDGQMLDAWVSFLRHFLRHFPEGNLVVYMFAETRAHEQLLRATPELDEHNMFVGTSGLAKRVRSNHITCRIFLSMGVTSDPSHCKDQFLSTAVSATLSCYDTCRHCCNAPPTICTGALLPTRVGQSFHIAHEERGGCQLRRQKTSNDVFLQTLQVTAKRR